MPSVRRVCRSQARAPHGPVGFTLIELLTVIAILTILASIGFGLIKGARDRAAIARAKSELALLAQALEEFRHHYGDYPQTGPAAADSQRVTALIGARQPQAVLFNSLTGVYGPAGPLDGRLNGPVLVDISQFTLEAALDPATFAVPAGSPPAKPEVANSFLDPWGNRYLYFYKRAATPPSPGQPAPANQWLAPAYLLYSAGPDGSATLLPDATGVFAGTTATSGDNADNLYSDRLP